jgi:glutathione S-transferase
MRARMALSYSQIPVEIREISLREKPTSLLNISPKATVPVFHQGNLIIEQSLDIMKWALAQHDPDVWYPTDLEPEITYLINMNDGPFKKILDSYKYPERIFSESYLPGPEALKSAVELFIDPLNQRLSRNKCLVSNQISLADIAIFPFIRQFSMVDPVWFANSGFHELKKWLLYHLESPLFTGVMQKYPTWIDIPQEKK